VSRRSRWYGAALVLAGVALVYLPVSDFALFLASRAAASLLAVAGLNLALTTGLFSFAHTAMFALGAYATALGVTDHGTPVWLGFLVAAAVGAAVGIVLSLATARVRATLFAVVSLVVLFAVNELLSGWTSVTHGEIGVSVRAADAGLSMFGAEVGARRYWLYLALPVTAALVLLARNLLRSPLGRAMVAVRESEAAAGAVGISTFRTRMLALGFGGAMAAVGGALFAHLDGYVSPGLAGFGPATLLVASILVGGAGTVWGPLIGVTFFLAVDRGLSTLQERLPGVDIQQLVSALALFAVIVLLPRGVAGRFRRRRSGERLSPKETPAVLPSPRQPAPDGMVLEVRGLAKAFGGIRAVDDVDLAVDAGTIHGLIGPNGSGKTTTVNLVTGVLPADRGQIRFLGQAIDRPRPHRMAALGLGRVFQRAEVLGSEAAADDVLTGFHLVAGRGLLTNLLRLPGWGRRERELRRQSVGLLRSLGIGERARVATGALPYGDRRLVEVARALAARPTLLILDEPATGLSAAELERLAGVLGRLREAGVTILLIEHNMEFLMGLCDRVTVLDHGRVIAEGTPAQVQGDAQVVEAYLGVAG
jgi:branched-chain amino acid transport system permease protein